MRTEIIANFASASSMKTKSRHDKPELNYPRTPDGRYFIVRGRLWRLSNPNLSAFRRELGRIRSDTAIGRSLGVGRQSPRDGKERSGKIKRPRKWAELAAARLHEIPTQPGTRYAVIRVNRRLTAPVVVLIWALTGPVFNYSDTWKLVINTGTTIITFLMVFLIQITQNRDTAALQIKLDDELILATQGARNSVACIEDASDALEEAQGEIRERAAVDIPQRRKASWTLAMPLLEARRRSPRK